MRDRNQDERLVIAERLRAAQMRLEVELKAADEKDEREAIARVLRAVRKMIDTFRKPELH